MGDRLSVSLRMGFCRMIYPARAGRFFLNTVNGQRGEYPIAGEIKECLTGFVRIGFVCPLGALAGKLSILAGGGHGCPLRPPTAQLCTTVITIT
jgi:hypothetical protein